jgi:putative ABC transport system substrate-binding protein
MVRAQQPATPVIGFLSGASPETMRELVAAFHRGLADTGFAEGRNVTLEYRWAEGNNDRLPALAMDLVHLKVTAIATVGSTPAALASKAATQTIPIVFFYRHRSGQSRSRREPRTARRQRHGHYGHRRRVALKRTGLDAQPDAAGHQDRRAHQSGECPPIRIRKGRHTECSAGFRRAHFDLECESSSDLEPAFETLVNEKIGALVVSGENFFLTQRGVMVALAARHAVPTIYAAREFVLAGGLMSYGTDQADAVRQVGVSVGRILKREKVADLPVQQVTKIQLAINLKTAKALGLNIPHTLIGRADEVIE